MKKVYLLILLVVAGLASAQKNQAIKITYGAISNGKPVETFDPIVVFSDIDETIITTESALRNKAPLPSEQILIERPSMKYFQVSLLPGGKSIATADSTSIAKQSFTDEPGTKKILGYACRKASTVINSNKIELWSFDGPLKGAPTILGQKLGLVLEMTRNGNYSLVAKKVEKIKAIPATARFTFAVKPVDLLTYRDLLWKSRFVTIPVFREETINWGNPAENDSTFHYAGGTVIAKKIHLPKIEWGSQVFVDVTQQSKGDAYDRTGSVFLIPQDRKRSFLEALEKTAKELPVYHSNGKDYQGVVVTSDYLPLLELMRFFTPFGIGQYNTIQLKGKNWEQQAFYRQDISDLASTLSDKEVWIGVFIGNYDKGGHSVSVNITIHPEEGGKAAPQFVLPLFNTVNVMEMAGQEYGTMFSNPNGLSAEFSLPKKLRNAKLRYVVTGHGGWENGDEFLQKKNTILIDGKVAFEFVPWRTDCGSYRNYNPASGNFSNGLSSSDYSRSNWCPGTTTNPVYIDLGDLDAGNHSISVRIPQGAPEGTSFSSWNVSGVLLGDQ
ncbi:MAG: peptide-N-glycosidase [Flavobacterium sp.]|nr:MAG: peptide-N-glycosidase [Flavobacterium sp.]